MLLLYIIGNDKNRQKMTTSIDLIIALRFRCIGIEEKLIDCSYNTVTCNVNNNMATVSCSGSK